MAYGKQCGLGEFDNETTKLNAECPTSGMEGWNSNSTLTLYGSEVSYRNCKECYALQLIFGSGPFIVFSIISTSSWIAHPRLLRFESHLAIDYKCWCLFVLNTSSDSGGDTYNAHDKRQNIYGFVVQKEFVWSVVIVIICFIMLLPLWWVICHCNEIESGWWSLSAVLYNLLHSNIDKQAIKIHGLLDIKI